MSISPEYKWKIDSSNEFQWNFHNNDNPFHNSKSSVDGFPLAPVIILPALFIIITCFCCCIRACSNTNQRQQLGGGTFAPTGPYPIGEPNYSVQPVQTQLTIQPYQAYDMSSQSGIPTYYPIPGMVPIGAAMNVAPSAPSSMTPPPQYSETVPTNAYFPPPLQ